VAEIKAVVSRAKAGDVSVLPRLRQLLTEYAILWQGYGDLAAQAEAAWARLAAGPDLHLRECLLRKAEALRQELAGPTPAPVERLLVERVVACWMQQSYHDALAAQALDGEDKPRLVTFRAQRQEQAQRQYLGALAALTALRKLLAGDAAKVRPSAPDHDWAGAERNGHRRNGHAADLPPGIQDRLGGLCGEVHSANNKEQRAKELCPV
jgi:hypothetical protein